MSNRICKMCGGKVIQDGYYAGSIFYKCQSCNRILGKDMTKVLTVFDKITESEETLAEKFVYQISDSDGYQWWTSMLCNDTLWELKAEAIAATAEELKKEYKK